MTATATAPAPMTASDSQVMEFCRKALAMMEQYNVSPTPENYTLFYMYASGVNAALSKDINEIMANKMPFSGHTLKNLYQIHIVSAANERLMGEATTGANKLLGEVLKVVNDFSKQTTNYNSDIDGYLGKISVDIEDHTLQTLVKDLISATVTIKQRGESLNNKLEESKNEIEHLKKNLEQLTQESQRDFLTGVYNRKALDKMLDDCANRSRDNNNEDLSVLMMDIDHFKQFNDKFGHLLGDEVLKIVARAITYCVRGKDIVARYGGEEFCVLLPGTPLSGALKVAETIRSTIASRDLKRKDTGESFGAITVSIGVAQLKRTDMVESFVKRADEALYKSKHHGRNRVTPEAQ